MNFKFSHSVIVKSPGLLPMMYKVGEIADELNIRPRTLYDWLNHGAPHHRDNSDHIWVNGKEFASWVDQVRRIGSGNGKLIENEGFCMRCKKIVSIVNPKLVQETGMPKMVKGTCSVCNGNIAKGVSVNGQS